MNEPLKWVLALSLSGSVLILLLALVRPLVRERFSRRWQYYIWLLVIVRLLAPVGAPVSPSENAVPPGENAAVFIPALPEAGTPDTDTVPREESPAPEPDPEPPALQRLGEAVWENLWVIWLAGALALLIRKATAYQSFVRYLRAGWEPVDDPTLLDRAAEIGAEIGVTRPVELYVNPLAASPMLLGVRRPRVVLPGLELPEEDFRFVLLHELTHYRRRDVLYKWLMQITLCVHWFNPLVHWMGRETERLGELSCDEAVLGRLEGPERRAYGDALLRTVSAGGGYQEAVPSPMLGADGRQLKERLDTIMKFKKTTRLSAVLAAVLVVLLGMTAAAAGAYAGLPPVIVAAGKSLPGEKKDAFRYTMETCYEAPYLFGIGWNLQKEEGTAVSAALPGGGRLTVYFTDSAKDLTKDKKAMEALTKALARLRKAAEATGCPMTRPLVYKWDTTSGGSPEELAEKYYEEGNLPFFKAVFAGLDKPEQASWMSRIYKDNSIAFFSVATAGLEPDGDLFTAFAEKAYVNGDFAEFSVLADRMDEETLEDWLERAKKDKRSAFQSILLNKLGMDKELDELEAWLDAAQAAEYKAAGVTMDGKDYYYQGELVNIFLDSHRLDNSVYTLNMNPEGTINIRIVRNAEGAVTGAAELTQEELKELFGEDDASVNWDALREKDDDWNWDWDWDDEKWTEQEKQLTEEYAAHGIVRKDDKTYYYQGKLVNIFLDLREDSSFYTLNMNPEGTVHIKVVRDTSGEITGIAELTREEIKDLFGMEYTEIPVELGSVKSGEYIWLGTYTMEEGDRVYYEVSAEKGDQLSVGFAKAGDKKPSTVYKTITNRRTDGKLEVRSDPMVWESPVEPGEYSLFVYAPSGALAKVSGQVTIINY